ncbi:MAG TPA: DUF1289 domain-containing protein [Crenotrichaceae bacterium]|nr:DUF1289 domain-containing protein [Crenotrichaceae bacterium]
MDQLAKEIPSPCIRSCCLDTDEVCMGCFRSLEEILQWSDSDNQTRKRILLKSGQRRIRHNEIMVIKRSLSNQE